MTPEDMTKYVNEQFAQGRSIESIARSLGVTPEYMYRKMAKHDEDDEEPKKK